MITDASQRLRQGQLIPSDRPDVIEFEIPGQPPSKSNCYRIVKIGKFSKLAKTAQVKAYETTFAACVPAKYRNLQLTGKLRVEANITFENMRRDLGNAEKVLLDCLQMSGVIKNDRDVWELLLKRHQGPNGKCRITITTLEE